MSIKDVYLQMLEEAKKDKEKPDFAKDSEKEDDGEGMDPVGKEDGDVDNDGDSDESDVYLKKRRETVTKAVKKDDKETDKVEESIEVTASPLVEAVAKKLDKKVVQKAKMAFSKTAGMDDKALEIVAKKTGLSLAQVKQALGESFETLVDVIMESGTAKKLKGSKDGKDEPKGSKEKALPGADYADLKNQGKEQGRWEDDPTTAAKMKAKACYENVEVIAVGEDGTFDAFIDGELEKGLPLAELDEAYAELEENFKNRTLNKAATAHGFKKGTGFQSKSWVHPKTGESLVHLGNGTFGHSRKDGSTVKRGDVRDAHKHLASRGYKSATNEDTEMSFVDQVAEAMSTHKKDPNRADRHVLAPEAKGELDFVDQHKTDVVDGAEQEDKKPETGVKSQAPKRGGEKRDSEPMKKVD